MGDSYSETPFKRRWQPLDVRIELGLWLKEQGMPGRSVLQDEDLLLALRRSNLCLMP